MAGKSIARKFLVVPHYERRTRYGEYCKNGDIFISLSQKPKGYILFQKNGHRGETLLRMRVEDFQKFIDFSIDEMNQEAFESLVGLDD